MNTRKEKRTPVTLKIKFKSATLGQFIERYSVDVSHGGIFIRTKDPLEVGTPMRFEFQLQDASPLIAGEGTVVWTREHDPTRAGVSPGMGVRFDKLSVESKQVLATILAQKGKENKGPRFDQIDTAVPTKVAPRGALPVPAIKKPRSATNMPLRPSGQGLGLAPKKGGFDGETSSTDSKEGTPLPNPMPFHSTVDDDFSNEVFDQPTRVAAVGEIMTERQQAHGLGSSEAVGPVSGELFPHEAEHVETRPISRDERVPSTDDSGAESVGDAFDNAATRINEVPASLGAEPQTRPRPATSVVIGAGVVPPKRSVSVFLLLTAIVVVLGAAVYVAMTRLDGTDGSVLAQTQNGPTPGKDSPSGESHPAIVPAVVIDAQPPGVVVPVSSVPPGATVLVDGEEKGVTPMTLVGLEEGAIHIVSLRLPCYKEYSENLDVGSDKEFRGTLKPLARVLRVTSEPSGATLFVDGERRGHTPRDVRLTGALSPDAPHVARVTKSRFEAAETKILPDAACRNENGQGVIEISLRLLPSESTSGTTSGSSPSSNRRRSSGKDQSGGTAPDGGGKDGDTQPDPGENGGSKPPGDTSVPPVEPTKDTPPPPPPPSPPAKDTPTATPPATRAKDKPAPTPPAKDKPATTPPAKDKPATTPPAKDKPASDEHTPDWMKDDQ